jgi:hypothetical protein
VNGAELFLGGMAALALVSVVVKAKAGARRAAAAAQIAQVGTSPVSLLGRVVVGALVIVGVQWLVIMHSANRSWVVVVLAVPALFTSFTLVKALTITEIRPGRGRRR